MAQVTALTIAPVKGMRLVRVPAVSLVETGPLGDRAFHVQDAGGKLALTTRNPGLVQVVPSYDPAGGRLELAFPGGRRVAGPVTPGEETETTFYDGRVVPGRVVEGPFAAALSEHLGRPVTLVARAEDVSGGDDHPVTLMSRASLAALGHELDDADVDARRFRMTIEVDGLAPWDEHGWAGSEVTVGEAVLRVVAPTVRCVVTTRSPEDGRTDLPVLRALADIHGTSDVVFGVWCDVVRPGRVAVGDAVSP